MKYAEGTTNMDKEKYREVKLVCWSCQNSESGICKIKKRKHGWNFVCPRCVHILKSISDYDEKSD